MTIKYSKDALKFLAKAEKGVVKNIRDAINGLTLIPPEGDIKMDECVYVWANIESYTDTILTMN